jgi:aconitate hydratase
MQPLKWLCCNLCMAKNSCCCSTTVHCDHLILKLKWCKSDLAVTHNKKFWFCRLFRINMESVLETRIRYYSPNCFRKLCIPGGMMIGTDSHTVNAGGLGMPNWGVGCRWCYVNGMGIKIS